MVAGGLRSVNVSVWLKIFFLIYSKYRGIYAGFKVWKIHFFQSRNPGIRALPIPGFGIEKNVWDLGIRDPGITIPNYWSVSIQIVATRCLVLRLKCTKLDFGSGSAAVPAGGAYSTPQTPLLDLGILTSKGRGCEVERERGKEGKTVKRPNPVIYWNDSTV